MIQVTDKYGINIYPDCYSVLAPTYYDKKTGKPNLESRWYYSTFHEALKKITLLEERDALRDCTDLKTALQTIEATRKEMERYIRKMVEVPM